MKRINWTCLVSVVVLFLSISACATFDPGQTTLKEWRRSYMPTRPV
jgi:hypothetical protein